MYLGKATEADINGIQAVAVAGWRATYANILTNDFIDQFLERAYNPAALKRAVENPASTFLVAKDEDRVVGYCQFGPSGEDTELYRLYILPDYWRKGIGRQLVEMMEVQLQAQGIATYGLFVHSQNEIGKAFYHKYGFVHDSERDKSGDLCEWYMAKQL